MKKVITYGTYDLLHQGHINLLRRAKELGDWLIVGVTTDKFDLERGKMNSYDNLMERIEAVKATGYADQIIIEEYKGQKIDDIRKYGVDIFAIGSDWEGYFDYLKEFCEVVYLPRTEGISSTLLRGERPSVKVGVIGSETAGRPFIEEAKVVNSIEIHDNLDECEAVYIASPNEDHYRDTKEALAKGQHVLCEAPIAFSTAQAEELFSLADQKGLVLMPAHRTAYCPAFRHLVSLLKSGVIGDIEDVDVSLFQPEDTSLDGSFTGSMAEMACYPVLPIVKMLGTEFKDIQFFSKMKDGIDVFTKAVFRYDHAVATFQVGLGTRAESSLVISGNKGYAYVPDPWWRTDFFELRYQNTSLNKKYFYPYVGEGLRYEIKDFMSCILNGSYQEITRKELFKMVAVQDEYLNGKNVFQI